MKTITERLYPYVIAFFIAGNLLAGFSTTAQKVKPPPSPVSTGPGGRLQYAPDSLGNRVPDFSYSGYMAGTMPIPGAPVRIVVPASKGDNTARIQAALDHVASLPAGKDGIRGVVLLQKGEYEVYGSLLIRASGVILRGSGMLENGTVLKGAGNSRETLVRVAGKKDRMMSSPVKITEAYVPVNAMKFRVATPSAFKTGDMVMVRRPSTLNWIKALGADHFGGGLTAIGWKPGQRDIFWDRKVLNISGNEITLDAPLTTALDSGYGGGTVAVYQWPGRIQQAGIENLRLVSAFDKNNPKDEDHRWMAITMENITDGWVRQVIFEHFAGSAVQLLETAKRITVEDCKSLKPVSEIGGQRRYTFFTTGQQTLFQRIYAEEGYHDFAVGFCAPGPNAFVQCEAHLPYSFSGTIDSWASGVLFDIVNIDGHALSLMNLGQDKQGAGWSGANSMMWNSTASRMDCYRPPTANNWAFGAWSEFSGDGHWEESNNHITPRSLYYAQLAERLGDKNIIKPWLLKMETEASSSPSVEVAQALTAHAADPAPLLTDWIDEAPTRNIITVQAEGARTIDQVGIAKLVPVTPAAKMHIENGWLVRGHAVVTGNRRQVPWWRGSIRPFAAAEFPAHITRFVPGRTGTGLTDDLGEVTDSMLKRNIVAMEHNYALWYERRRDDHERIRRMNGDVWPPFLELPYARSGQGTAWDGLSRYDLTKFNNWYWNRLKQFADLADQKGLVLVHQNYFQHNIIEAGAHYADFPWRPANNINNTGFPEPVPYAGDKRIFMAAQFYDVTHPVRRELHRAYIRKCLNNFSGNNGVIQLIGEEFTGPLHFVQFWLDVISEWKKETGKEAIIGLSTTKDVQDAILADPARAAVVNLVDIRYWHYQEDGTAYAPNGGLNLAPRQHARLLKPKKTSFAQVYRAVREYRDKYPGKAVMYSGDAYDNYGWAAFMGGGSMVNVPGSTDPELLAAAATMKPVDAGVKQEGVWALQNEGKGYIFYSESQQPVQLDLAGKNGTFRVRWIDPRTGRPVSKDEKLKGGKQVELKSPKQGAALLWVTSL